MSRIKLGTVLVGIVSLSGSLPGFAQDFQVIEFPGASETAIRGINDLGHFVGEYGDVIFSDFAFPGGTTAFIHDGAFRSISPPNAISSVATDLNNVGTVVGNYIDGNGTSRAFMLQNGQYSNLEPPGATVTMPLGVNDNGIVVGAFTTDSFVGSLEDLTFHGFVYDGNSYDIVEYGNGRNTQVNAINASGQVAGLYLDSSMGPQGFIDDDANSFLGPIGDFGAALLSIATISDSGLVYGTHMDVLGLNASTFELEYRMNAFVYNSDAFSYSNVELPAQECSISVSVLAPAAPDRCIRVLEDVNASGTVVGYFDNNDGRFLGFVGVSLVGPGDFDANGQLTVADLHLLSESIATQGSSPEFDVNADGKVNVADLAFWVEAIKGSYMGDANLDGEFNSTDLVMVLQAGEYEDDLSANSRWETGDWNADREFDSGDLVAAFAGGGYEQGRREAIAANLVPEPTSLAYLVATALGIFPVLRPRRR